MPEAAGPFNPKLAFSKSGDRLLEIFGPGRGCRDCLAGARMRKPKRIGVEHLPFCRVVGLRPEPRILFSTVNFVAGKWITEMLEVNADLVRASGVQRYLHQRRALQPLEDPKAGPRFAPFSWLRNRHASAVRWMARDGGLDLARRFWNLTTKNRVINLFDGAIPELVR